MGSSQTLHSTRRCSFAPSTPAAPPSALAPALQGIPCSKPVFSPSLQTGFGSRVHGTFLSVGPGTVGSKYPCHKEHQSPPRLVRASTPLPDPRIQAG